MNGNILTKVGVNLDALDKIILLVNYHIAREH